MSKYLPFAHMFHWLQSETFIEKQNPICVPVIKHSCLINMLIDNLLGYLFIYLLSPLYFKPLYITHISKLHLCQYYLLFKNATKHYVQCTVCSPLPNLMDPNPDILMLTKHET